MDERSPAGRPVAGGGVRRAVIGTGVGLLAGVLLGLVLPRDPERG